MNEKMVARPQRYGWRLAVLGFWLFILNSLLFLELPSPHIWFDIAIVAVLAPLNLWFLSRVWLVRQFQKFGLTDSKPSPGEIAKIKPQQDALETLQRMLMPANALDGRAISLKSPWGGGKSTVLRRLQQEIEIDSRSHVLTWINIWEAETETELHRAIYETILFTPAIFERCWFSLPWSAPRLSLLLRRFVRSIKIAFKNSSIEAEANIEPELPMALTVQKQIDWIISRLRSLDFGLVIVLEEIDRATPAMAKLAITAAQRSLHRPGVTVILPYVQEHLWFKVFNPLDPGPADLTGSMNALIYESLANDKPATSIPSPEWLGLYGAKEPPAKITQQNGAAVNDVQAPLASWWRYELHSRFAVMDNRQKRRLLRRFSEKYIGSYQVELRPLTARDLFDLICNKESLFTLTLAAFPALQEMGSKDAKKIFSSAMERHFKILEVTRLRHFEHFYLRLLERLPSEIPAEKDGDYRLRQLVENDAHTAASMLAGVVALAVWYGERMTRSEET